MATMNFVPAETLSDPEAELGDLRSRLSAGLEQARRGELADGSGEDAIRRAFARARDRSRPEPPRPGPGA